MQIESDLEIPNPAFRIDVVEQKHLGMCAYAVLNIGKDQIICEYTGEICDLSKCRNAKECLVLGKITKQNIELGIITDAYANVGRFFSGVSPWKKQKANCEIRLCIVKGIPRVFIFSIRDIEPCEIFYVDYGAEYEKRSQLFCYKRYVSFNNI